MKLGEIADCLGCRLLGDPEIEITGLAPIEEAEAGQLTFLTNPKYRRYLARTKAAAIIIDQTADLPPRLAALISPNPYLTFAQALGLFFSPGGPPQGVHPLASVSPQAQLGARVSIGPFSSIGEGARIGNEVTILSHCAIYPNAEIGAHSFIHSHCVVREACRLGRHVILQNGVVVGSDGFGYAKRADHTWHKIPQTGTVVIEDEVEIGSGSVVDRATLGVTRIGRGTKIDNQVQIGHGSSVGQDSLLCAQVGLAGSTQVGNQVILGGQVGAAGHLKIGDRVLATAQTGIPSSVAADRIISGYPAIDHREWLKAVAIFPQLPQLQRELRQMRIKLGEMVNYLKPKGDA